MPKLEITAGVLLVGIAAAALTINAQAEMYELERESVQHEALMDFVLENSQHERVLLRYKALQPLIREMNPEALSFFDSCELQVISAAILYQETVSTGRVQVPWPLSAIMSGPISFPHLKPVPLKPCPE